MLGVMNDEFIGRNIAARRGDISQSDLAQLMRAKGYAWQQKTVSLIEKGERSIRLNEAADMADILGMELNDLLREPNAPSIHMELDLIKETAKCEASANVLEGHLEKFLTDYQDLRFGVSLALYSKHESKALLGGLNGLESFSLWNLLNNAVARLSANDLKELNTELGGQFIKNPEKLVEELTGLKKATDSSAYNPYEIFSYPGTQGENESPRQTASAGTNGDD